MNIQLMKIIIEIAVKNKKIECLIKCKYSDWAKNKIPTVKIKKDNIKALPRSKYLKNFNIFSSLDKLIFFSKELYIYQKKEVAELKALE